MVHPRTRRWAVLLPVALLLAIEPGRAQSPEPAPEAEAPVVPAPKTRPPPRKPKPKPKPAEAAPTAAPAPAPVVATPPASRPAPAPMPAANLPGLTVLCEAKAAHYEGPKDFAVWVTRTGAIVVENPLRPLTPETTRVLQVVIAGKAATAYGPDLFALRRGGSPAALEAMLGGPVRWDAVPTALPDTLNIVSDTGQSLAQLGFQECGEAPAVRSAPVAQGKAKGAAKGAAADSRRPGARAKAASPDAGAKAPLGLHLPQGVIP
ncbi:hypothetical protein [Methylobacterium sp. J-068]|uniref:hypothetical protein n=1 Tax=Methylobacterium sp. J-068 TaxID=2836649 RepID=UPI001FBB45F7|nr:hypothetical protein [Methylobacterium sp. J-068]MCJ2034120.1 hypothetical protein [Methylobacterium sp. J-068]